MLHELECTDEGRQQITIESRMLQDLDCMRGYHSNEVTV